MRPIIRQLVYRFAYYLRTAPRAPSLPGPSWPGPPGRGPEPPEGGGARAPGSPGPGAPRGVPLAGVRPLRVQGPNLRQAGSPPIRRLIRPLVKDGPWRPSPQELGDRFDHYLRTAPALWFGAQSQPQVILLHSRDPFLGFLDFKIEIIQSRCLLLRI